NRALIVDDPCESRREPPGVTLKTPPMASGILPSGDHSGTGSDRLVRVFVSSPVDARFERIRVERVVERLNGEFAGVAALKALRWEQEFYTADKTFQAQIPEAADCEIVIAILRHRLGTPLPDDF